MTRHESLREWHLLDSGKYPSGGEGGIRTPETLSGLRAFQARALGHYATSPWTQEYDTSWRSRKKDAVTSKRVPS